MDVIELDIAIYGKKLWVAISNDGKRLNGRFRHAYDKEGVVFDERFLKYQAVTAKVEEVESGNLGVLIVFRRRDYMTCQSIAHESTHAAGYVYDYINEDIRRTDEPYAYLVGWIADCCWRIKKSKK